MLHDFNLMTSLSYSQIVQMAPSKERMEECKKELYSKECVAHSINFVVNKASKESNYLEGL